MPRVLTIGALVAALGPLSAAAQVAPTGDAPMAGAQPASADGGDDDEEAPAGADRQRPQGRIEVKRQNTSRGTPSESTKTTLRFERYLDGAVSALRLDMPFPDEKTSFGGDPFEPRLGDVKFRVRFRNARVNGVTVGGFTEITLPTADPESLGSGKVQVSAAINAATPLRWDGAPPLRATWEGSAQAQQVVSITGDPDTPDINQTKLELALRARWGEPYAMKLTLKPVIDWEQNGKTGAVLELEGGWHASALWSSTLMFGRRLWGEGVPGTYSNRVELSVAYLY